MKSSKRKDVVKLMIELYCHKNHNTHKGCICDDCKALYEYVELRNSKCPFKEQNIFCTNCKVHCYKSDMRKKISQVMRFSGPRMILYHPIIAIEHLYQTLKNKRRIKNEK